MDIFVAPGGKCVRADDMVGPIRRDMGLGPLSRHGDDSDLGEIFLDLLSHAELNKPVTCRETNVHSSPPNSPLQQLNLWQYS